MGNKERKKVRIKNKGLKKNSPGRGVRKVNVQVNRNCEKRDNKKGKEERKRMNRNRGKYCIRKNERKERAEAIKIIKKEKNYI